MTIFGPVDHRASKDVPCTVSLHFMVRSGALELVVYMRSNDVWLGWPYDVVMFTVLQEAMATDLGLELGQYTHVDGSLHLYDTNREQVEALIHSSWRAAAATAPPPDEPIPAGTNIEEVRGYALAILVAYRRDLTLQYVLRDFWPQFFAEAAFWVLKGKG